MLGSTGERERQGPRHLRRRAAPAALLAISLALAWAAPAAIAAELHVTSSADSGGGTLRQAVLDAGNGDTIVIDPGVNPRMTTGQIEINESVSIVGQGAGLTNITADNDPPSSPTFRAFFVTGGASVLIQDVSISGGRAPAGGAGPTGAAGGNGGGILADATLAVDGVNIIFNRAGNGGLGASTGGAGGLGGGIYSTGAGPLTITNSAITTNDAGKGGTGMTGNGGVGGVGGGVYSAGPLTIVASSITRNEAGDGGSSVFASQANGGDGGGIAHTTGGNLFISHSTIYGNFAGTGADNNNPGGTGGTGGHGGGVHSDGPGTFTLLNSTVTGNFAGAGGAPFEEGPVAEGPGEGGDGGGVFFDGSPGLGTIVHSTVTGNDAGIGGEPGSHGGHGGGFFASGDPSKLSLRNTIVAANTAFPKDTNGPNCAGMAITDAGTNIAFPADPLCSAGFMVVDPLLDPFGLDTLGGPTETIALLAGSPAIDAVTNCTDAAGAPLTTDQRGLPRPYGPACDIGAFERQPLPAGVTPRNPQLLTKKDCRKRGKKLVKRKGKRRCVKKKKKKRKRKNRR